MHIVHYDTIIVLSTMPDVDGMLAKALLVGNFEAGVDICVSVDRMVSSSHYPHSIHPPHHPHTITHHTTYPHTRLMPFSSLWLEALICSREHNRSTSRRTRARFQRWETSYIVLLYYAHTHIEHLCTCMYYTLVTLILSPADIHCDKPWLDNIGQNC